MKTISLLARYFVFDGPESQLPITEGELESGTSYLNLNSRDSCGRSSVTDCIHDNEMRLLLLNGMVTSLMSYIPFPVFLVLLLHEQRAYHPNISTEAG